MKILKEFKAFISRGNVMDLAVAVVMGAAFTAIVNALVESIIMPLIGILTGGVDFSKWGFTIGGTTIAFGAFIGAVINFVLIALVIFLIVKAMNGLKRKKPEPPVVELRVCDYCKMPVEEGATRCPHCTSVLVAADGTVQTPEKPDRGVGTRRKLN